jgi:hypothetical protein
MAERFAMQRETRPAPATRCTRMHSQASAAWDVSPQLKELPVASCNRDDCSPLDAAADQRHPYLCAASLGDAPLSSSGHEPWLEPCET